MAKKTVETLESLTAIYGKNKIQENKCKKTATEAGNKIKKMIAETVDEVKKGVTYDVTSQGYHIHYSVTEEIKFKEEVLEYMHKHKEFAPCIKTKEYVDMEVLEDLMYKGEIPKKLQSALAPYKTVKYTPKLNVEEVSE